MATRGASVGILASLAIFALLTLVLFVTTVIFAARSQRLSDEREVIADELAAAIRPEEQNDRWEELKRDAGARQGVVAYLDATNAGLVRAIGLPRGAGVEELESDLAGRLGLSEDEAAPALLRLIDNQEARIRDLSAQLDRAKGDYDTAVADKEVAIRAKDEQRNEHRSTVQTLTAEIDRTKELAEQYRVEVEATKDKFSDSLAADRSKSAQEIAQLSGELQEAEDQLLVFREMIDNLRGAQRAETLRGPDEATLVDGQILSVDATSSEVTISRGRRDHVVLGMSFEVYNAGTTIRPNAEGNYPRGKATIEVTRVDESSSRARVLRLARGNPLVEGDSIVNPVYDPRKVYHFAVFGHFDTNYDGEATAREAEQMKGFVTDWGGKVTDTVTGNTDFLVLGTPPLLPPDPRPDDPIEVIERYLRLKRVAQQYDEMFETAKQTSLPVLNQNRFFTLTGLYAQP